MQTVAITHQKGGVGKTTLTAWLGAFWASQGLRVGLLDLDPQRSLLQHPPNSVPVFGPEDEQPDDLDLLLVDTPPYLREELAWLLTAADLVVVPLKPSALDIEAAASTVELIRRQGVKVPVRFVLNMVGRGKLGLETSQALEVYGVPICKTLIPHRVAYIRGMVDGVLDDAPAQSLIQNLADELAQSLTLQKHVQ